MTHDSLPGLGEIADVAAELAQLRDSANEILRQAWSVDSSRRLLDGPGPAFDHELWKTIAALGWPDVLVSDSRGGGGASIRELCVLAEALGAVVAPIPLPTAAAACWCEDRCSDGIGVVLDDVAAAAGDSASGQWPVVTYGAIAKRLIVLAKRGDTTVLGVVDCDDAGVQREALTPLDHNPAARIALANARIEIIAENDEAQRRHRHATTLARLAAVAELVGVAAAANEAAVEYAKVRVAFGRPIGAFQAIKHRLVDQRAAIEVARALVNRAADACEHDHADADALVSLAAFWAIDSLRSVPEGAVQVFGGIGYTWEHNAHVYLRRAASITATLGPRSHHRSVISTWLRSRHGAQR